MSLLVLLGLLPAFVNADSVVNECNTGSECANFGYKYYIGEGVKQDDFKAVEFYQKACGLNYGRGCSNLGVSYEYGEGVRKSGIKALEYYGKACDLKSVIGCKNYARLKK